MSDRGPGADARHESKIVVITNWLADLRAKLAAKELERRS